MPEIVFGSQTAVGTEKHSEPSVTLPVVGLMHLRWITPVGKPAGVVRFSCGHLVWVTCGQGRRGTSRRENDAVWDGG